MYPGTIFNWYDQSANTTSEASQIENAPLFLTAISADRGPEDMRVVSGQEFFSLYGEPSFVKHGQPAIQAANIINNGGRLLIKRVVAEDATLANTIFVASVKSSVTATPTTDGTGKTLKEIQGQVETDTSAQKYSTKGTVSVKWTAVSVADAVDANAVIEKAQSLLKEEDLKAGAAGGDGAVTLSASSDYPMFIVVDNGRGISEKSVRLVPDYTSSKNRVNFFYTLYVYDGTTILDSQTVSANPDAMINKTNYGLDEHTSVQVKFYTIDGVFAKYVATIAAGTGLTEDEVYASDVLNLKTVRKVALEGATVDEESVNLNADYGVTLENGTDGSFGSAPFGTDAYTNQLIQFFDGTFDDSIFDVDEFKIAAVVDANYPESVKEAIAKLVRFREDCFFFRDLGTDVKSYDSIISKMNGHATKNRYVGDYMTTYDMYDEYSGKRIKVTMLYDLAGLLVAHFAGGAFRPIAGIANGFILPSAIAGTVNFTPRITPKVNQKTLLEDLRINYAIFQQGQCVVQSLYTSQEPYTQLTYINNVLAIQEVARAVRTSCPRYRYTFVSGNDFSEYARNVSKILANYSSNFASLGFTYTQDAATAAQKIFYATIQFRFNNWAQTEEFDLYALPTETESTTA